jgi:predicted ATPase
VEVVKAAAVAAMPIPFAPLRDPALVVSTATTAIGFLPSELESGGQPLLETLCHRLATRRLLLVLDNCEHLVEPISEFTHTLLARCPQLTVLATSRETLAISGERVCPIPPFAVDDLAQTDPAQLAASDAVQLFCERARAAVPGFALTPANADPVARICQRLDGIALALELAAARIRVLGAHKLAERLTERLRLLATGPRTTAPRHQTLRAAIDWSYQLLPPAEQTMLTQLSVFPASFDLDAAEAITDIGPEPADPGFETLDLLTRLVDKSLIVVSADPGDIRYRLLETIREYASEKLHAADAHQAAHRRHRDFFRTAAESYPLNIDFAPRIRLAATDLENFRAALTWSLDQGETDAIVSLAAMLWPYWDATGGTEGIDWLEHAVAAPGPAPLPAQLQVRVGLAMALRHRGTDQRNRCVTLCEDALAIARESADLHAAAHCNVVLVDLAIASGQLDRAEHIARETYIAFQACGSREEQALSHLSFGVLLTIRGDYTQAHQHLEAALTLGPLGDWLLAHVLATQALNSALIGRPDSAERLAHDAVRAAHRLPACDVSVMALTRAAQAAVLSGRIQTARRVLTDLLELLSTLGFHHWVADALELTAIVLSRTDPASAAALLGAARTPRELLGESTPIFMSDQLAGCQQRTAAALGAQPYVEHEQAGPNKTIHEALTFALNALGPENRPINASG